MLLKVPGAEVFYDERGQGDPVVLLHAFPFDGRMWERQVSDLVWGMRIITVDFRGLGRSTGSGSIDDAADDVVRVLDALRIQRATVGGLSMGGYVALALARRHPARLAGLLLADTRANADDEAGRATRDESITLVAREGVPAFVGRFVPRLVTGRAPRVLHLARAMAEIQSPEGVAGALAALRDRPDATAVLPTIRVPTTVLVGAEDALSTPAVMRPMAEAIAGARYVELPDAGHLANLEAPTAFSDEIERLVERVRAAG